MCGIAGLISSRDRHPSADDFAAFAGAMDASLRHRGPDGHDVWIDRDAGVALVHRRLAIIDVSQAGHQPMPSSDGRYVISYNGEVYSHLAIRAELEAAGHIFRGHSDTEVIIESVARSGIVRTVERLIGMFAIAIWDRHTRTLTLVRDRLGIKPVYWANFDGVFAFGSELKALRAYPGWKPRIDASAVASFMRYGYVPAPHSIYQGVYKLEPGTILTLAPGCEPTLEKFWDARRVAIDGIADPLRDDDTVLTDRLEALLIDAVGKRMMADVPLGAFLSGGIDSSTVVALMKAADTGPVKTFSIGFEQAGFDEAQHAAAIARHLNTDHTELTVTPRNALDVVPSLADIYDEPFADSSQIPTYLISAMTRQHVTVALSGDGGDELFAGYNRHRLVSRYWASMARMPLAFRKLLARGMTAAGPARWDQAASLLGRSAPSLLGDKLHKLAAVLGASDADALYLQLVSQWSPDDITPGISEARGILSDDTVRRDIPDILDRFQFLDTVTYLPDDILTKVDRASMAVGLEARVPLLDHRVVALSWRLPHHAKIRNGVTKWALRQVLYRHVPRELVDRPKMGFAIPLAEWLRGPLRDWAEVYLAEARLSQSGYFDTQLIRNRWAEHLSGRRNWAHPLWNVLMFQAWRARWG